MIPSPPLADPDRAWQGGGGKGSGKSREGELEDPSNGGRPGKKGDGQAAKKEDEYVGGARAPPAGFGHNPNTAIVIYFAVRLRARLL